MKTSSLLLASLLISSSLFASDYSFIDPAKPWHIEGYSRATGKLKERHYPSSLRYVDGGTSLYYSHFLNPENALSWQLGYYSFDLHWKDSPLPLPKDFSSTIASVAWISHAVEDWRWVLNGGLLWQSTDSTFYSPSYYGLMWGRYAYKQDIALHIGWLGYTGLHQDYVLPLLGFDWSFAPSWKLNAIFPLDFSLNYTIHPNWSTSLSYTSFGGFYRFPYRLPRREHAHRDTMSIYGKGIELALKYQKASRYFGSLGVGQHLGGWTEFKTEANSDRLYYKYKGAPYFQAQLGLTF